MAKIIVPGCRMDPKWTKMCKFWKAAVFRIRIRKVGVSKFIYWPEKKVMISRCCLLKCKKLFTVYPEIFPPPSFSAAIIFDPIQLIIRGCIFHSFTVSNNQFLSLMEHSGQLKNCFVALPSSLCNRIFVLGPKKNL